MRIQHNIAAMNSYRNYNTNASALSKNLEKLSSGYRINRAGDDAAGLAISEKMRAQIAGLDQAQANVKDGISLVKTAEGALQEVQDMMNRMVTLATQSANGTYQDAVDRENLQKEVTALKKEIDRIADSSNFNGQKLLNGELENGGSIAGTAVELNATVTTREESTTAVKPTFSVNLDGLKIAVDGTGTGNGTMSLTIGGATLTSGDIALTANTPVEADDIATAFNGKTVKIGDVTYTAANSGTSLTFTADIEPKNDTDANADFAVALGNVTGTGASIDASSSINTSTQVITSGVVADPTKQATVSFDLTTDMVKDGSVIKIGDSTYTVNYAKKGAGAGEIGVKDLLNDKGELEADDLDEIANRLTDVASSNTMFSVGSNGTKITLQSLTTDITDLTTQANVLKQVSVTSAATPGEALTLQIGDTADSYNQLKVSINDMHTTALGIADIDISNIEGAQKAIETIKTAINTVSSTRGDLGAIQNRLEHTQNNLSVMEENIQDAESTIRDTDIADEMTTYTKNNILLQSAQAMLAQANQMPQGVLQLLQ